jgi:hypothetical protein
MEIIVATTIFAVVSVSMMALFDYTLKINRRSEALRQATQGMRNFVEFLVKEVRNGQIDYAIVNGITPGGSIGPCGAGVVGTNYYSDKENKLRIINTEGDGECIYYGDQFGNALAAGTFASDNGTVVLWKAGTTKQVLNPPNFKVGNLMFLIRPLCDPYTVKPPGCVAYSSDYPRIQPFVTILAKFIAQLPTGEKTSIYYQTSVSTNRYDIPNQ